jgi:hypothetical protein
MSAVGKLKAELAGYENDDLLASIESETDALELMDRVIEHVVADEALVERGKARLKRIEARADRHRDILKAMMEQIAEKVERPLATLSLGTGPRTAIVTDQAAIPDVYWRRAVDKAELLKALKAGPVQGAELSNGSTVLTIRPA